MHPQMKSSDMVMTLGKEDDTLLTERTRDICLGGLDKGVDDLACDAQLL